MEKLAVVVLNYNGVNHLKNFIPTLIQFSLPHQVYVVDNASDDGSIQFLNSLPDIKIIQLEKNHGFAGGYNVALKSIDAQYLAIINSDIEVTPNWAVPLLDYLECHPTCAAVQPKILSFLDKTKFDYAGAAGGFIDYLGYPYCRGRIFDTIEKDLDQYNEHIQVDWTSGACMLIRSDVFSKVEGFDDRFFAHMEEIDLCWRIRKLGYELYCLPESIVYHVGGGTLSSQSPFKTYLNFRNNLAMLCKNLPRKKLWILGLRIVLDWAAAMLLAWQKNMSHALQVFKAHWHFFKNFTYYISQRKKVSSEFGDNKPKCVLFQYYIKRRKIFSQIK